MPRPILSSRLSDEVSNAERNDAEEPLLTRPTAAVKKQIRGTRWTQLALLIWAAVATTGELWEPIFCRFNFAHVNNSSGLGVVVFGVLYQHSKGGSGGRADTKFPPSGKRNVIFMVSDGECRLAFMLSECANHMAIGMGPTSLHVTRSWKQYTKHLHYNNTLFLDQHIIGTSRTRSSNSLVTDSAAGATAFSCGMKSYNGAISVLPDHSPCGTVLEAAKKAGYMTGLVVTTRITEYVCPVLRPYLLCVID